MRAVGIRELKNHLSEFVRLVRSGEEVLVTDRGVVVAELRMPRRAAVPDDPYPGISELARQGSLTLGSPNEPGLYPALEALMPEGEAACLLDEERGDL